MTARTGTRVRPTIFGIVVAVVLVVAAIVRPPVADPSVTGLVWAGLLGALVLGAVWPVVAVRLVGVRVVAAPSDLVVGQLATLELELTGRASGLVVGATGSGAAVIDTTSPGRVRVPFTVARRGAYSQVRVDLGSDAPFGVLYATRSRRVDVPHLLLVGPTPQPWPVQPGPLPVDRTEPVPAGVGSSGDSVRSVRPYVTGDPAHLVHWPSSARTGELVVRELEPPAAHGIAIVVDLGRGDADDAAVEDAAARACGAARHAHERGARVLLCTTEASGPVAAEAPDELSVQRRLALAVAGTTPPTPPEGWPAVRIAPAVGAQPESGAGETAP
jgi:uncharacterized protein (DUF58 family)